MDARPCHLVLEPVAAISNSNKSKPTSHVSIGVLKFPLEILVRYFVKCRKICMNKALPRRFVALLLVGI